MRNKLIIIVVAIFINIIFTSCGDSEKVATKKTTHILNRKKENLPEEPQIQPIKIVDIADQQSSVDSQHKVTNTFKGDLPELKKRRFLRVLTRNNPACYYIHRGMMMGFEYELIKKFAEENGMEVVMLVPPTWDDMIPWLLEGRGDIIAGAMTLTKDRKDISGLGFGKSYATQIQSLFCRKEDKNLKKLSDLKGRDVFVRKNSVYWDTLCELRRKGASFNIREVPPDMETYEILEGVRNGKFDLSVADIRFTDLAPIGDDLLTPFTLGEELRYVWGVRKENVKLQEAVNKFIAKEYRGKFYNIIYRRYLKSSNTMRKFQESATENSYQKFSKYDKIIKKYAGQYNIPWYIIAAQVFQESRFDPDARSWCGTEGLMQLTKATAKEMKCKDIHNSEENIKAGVKYMRRLLDRIPGDVSEFDKRCFALASYNGGYGHLQDARKLAKQLNLNPDVWFNNVENAISLLSHKKYYSKAKYGYCRSSEIINYVKDIVVRSKGYKQAVQKE